MKKLLNKKDLIYICLVSLAFLLIIFINTGSMYIYGSNLDWNSQHIAIPEYFRSLFYETKDLFPDFALNLGNGQNIYNFSYYGLLSPLYLLSYFLPKVSMTSYIITITIISMIASIFLIYSFLKSKKYSSEVCFTSVFLFAFSSCIMMHTHRHLMFINYFPFLIMGLFGVDKKLNNGKGWLLSLSVFLIIMTSYYYSIGSLIALTVYAIYKYLKSTKKVTFQSFFKAGVSYLLPVIIGILSSAIIILPTFQTLLNNRASTTKSISFIKLLFPDMNIKSIIYSSYGIGLTGLIIPAIINFYKKKKENLFMAIILTLLAICPIFSYFLNATMYSDSKALIPFLPLYIIIIANFLDSTLCDKINLRQLIIFSILVLIVFALATNKFNKMSILYLSIDLIITYLAIFLYNHYKNEFIIIIPVILIAFVSGLSVSNGDEYVLKYKYRNDFANTKKLISQITDNDNTFYRISNNDNRSVNPNRLYENNRYYTSTVYSSVSNQKYNHFYYDALNSNIEYRNRTLTTATNNIMSLMLNGNKYMISRSNPLQGYTKIIDDYGTKVYQNDDVLPLGYASSNIMSNDDYDKLKPFVKEEALLKNIIADTKSSNNFVSSIQQIDLNFKEIFKENYIKQNKDGSYTIDIKENKKIVYDLPKEYQNKILFIRLKMSDPQSCSIGDQVIKINNSKNKLTCKDWKYYNNNRIFNFTLAEQKLNKLTITITKGHYQISDLESYMLDYANIETINKEVDHFNVNMDKTKGDKIIGDIDVTKEGYFMLTIPYDKGFNIKVNQKETAYELVDGAYIGFKIKKGHHDIEITYEAPLKKFSLFISTLGIVCFVIVTILENKRQF